MLPACLEVSGLMLACLEVSGLVLTFLELVFLYTPLEDG